NDDAIFILSVPVRYPEQKTGCSDLPKIKKPVDLGFVDFTRIEGRRRACHEECRLNRRLAEPIYIAVVPIVRVGRTCMLNA
ncbi:hypothetical protein, partial [Caballeronia choica]|uniref:hypothetical protein n=1 Tax=Caballeronia choica TaxID=326476 RepID=UPI000AEFAE7C